MIWLYFGTFMLICAYSLYLILSLNVKGIIFLIILLIIQSLVAKKNRIYVDFVRKYVRPW